MRHFMIWLMMLSAFAVSHAGYAAENEEQIAQAAESGYRVGADDLLDISILQPEKLSITTAVAPDGSITFPYIGNLAVKGMALSEIQDTIQRKLSEGYMKYPVVSVSMRESRSKKFFVYGEVARPGAYPIEENISVLQAISLAGGFTKFGSASRVKILRPRKDKPGYETVKVNINAVMHGASRDDIILQPGDIVVISEGIL